MPRLLFLASFLVVCLLALPGADLFAAQTGDQGPVSSVKSSGLKSSATLAKILQNAGPLGSSGSKISSTKSKKSLKSATSKHKKLTTASAGKLKKHAYKKTKSSKQSYRKTRSHKKSNAGKIRASKRSPHRS